MLRKEIDSSLSSFIRRGKGFYYNGKKFSSIDYGERLVMIYTKDYREVKCFRYEDIEKIVLEPLKDSDKIVRIIYGKETSIGRMLSA